jgi:hypothetical protein
LLCFPFFFSFFAHTSFVDARDEAPEKLATYFKAIIKDLRSHNWVHYLNDDASNSFDYKSLSKQRGLDLDPESLWLGPNMLRRSVESLFNSIRKVFYTYQTTKVAKAISTHLPPRFSTDAKAIQEILAYHFHSFEQKTRKRRRDEPPSPATSDHKYESVLLEGRSSRHVALLFKWTGLPLSEATWHQLSFQDNDFQEWWAEEREARYPLIPEGDFQIPLVRHRNGPFVRNI